MSSLAATSIGQATDKLPMKDIPLSSRKTAPGNSIEGVEIESPRPTGTTVIGQSKSSLGAAPSDTPATTAPNSPRIRPTTLDIPGLTKSRASPDGRIAQRDVGAKLVIVMVGLPARGKSYVTKKIARYLNWLQHDTRIFNVGERRRIAAKINPASDFELVQSGTGLGAGHTHSGTISAAVIPSVSVVDTSLTEGHGENQNTLGPPAIDLDENSTTHSEDATPAMAQDAHFFDPENVRAAQLREQVAMSTLDELLDYVLYQGGSVGILDATNSTLERRKHIIDRVRERAGAELGVLFLESQCLDKNLLESNMRLKLSGPDYKDKDPVTALADFRERVAIYEKNYVPIGEYEERHNLQYVQMIDVGRKVVSHQIRGFLAAQTVYYLLNFNLAARQIWITRHGESLDNVNGKIGGDSNLSENGMRYAQTLAKFIGCQKKAFSLRQVQKQATTHFPPLPGDTTPPNPEYTTTLNGGSSEPVEKNFCVWTSMLKRSVTTGQYFDEDEYDVKQMRMLDELNAGVMEGMTYDEIRKMYADEYELRRTDKLHYRYPGAGGEGYLDVINRLRAVIVEVERTTDHVLLIVHRSVARVLLAYFMGLKREDVADLDVPLGTLYCLEPKPYGVEFKAYRYHADTEWFYPDLDYKLQRAASNQE
ncbi:hypothetical protein FGG08_003688 [Glutinoglossum americanum]|uniref:6-phosphofructo-2-kinase domain-containing protein n=1 Tax=Glutinoglossum americanum TaxID=1670608 RepID=A0A9P8L4J9_9PEZI|nr:hypothetical protein FGG08_003688 [Glutinoglossum americanum]